MSKRRYPYEGYTQGDSEGQDVMLSHIDSRTGSYAVRLSPEIARQMAAGLIAAADEAEAAAKGADPP